MLIFENVAMFEAIYDAAKKCYPELRETMIVVGYTDSSSGVLLLEGTEEDAGKYKIAINSSGDDDKITATFFMAGLAMLVYRLKYDNYVHPLAGDEFAINDEYKEILSTLTKAFEHVPYGGEYGHE